MVKKFVGLLLFILLPVRFLILLATFVLLFCIVGLCAFVKTDTNYEVYQNYEMVQNTFKVLHQNTCKSIDGCHVLGFVKNNKNLKFVYHSNSDAPHNVQKISDSAMEFIETPSRTCIDLDAGKKVGCFLDDTFAIMEVDECDICLNLFRLKAIEILDKNKRGRGFVKNSVYFVFNTFGSAYKYCKNIFGPDDIDSLVKQSSE